MSAELVPDDAAPLAVPASFTVPLADLGEFADMPERRRNEVNVLLGERGVLTRVHVQLREGKSLQGNAQLAKVMGALERTARVRKAKANKNPF